MSFNIIAEGDYACFTRPEFKVERVSYDAPTPGALEGLLKSIYWKPAIRYVIDQIVIFNPIHFANIRRNEVKSKISLSAMKKQMRGEDIDPCIYTAKDRTQKAAMVLQNVKYGVRFHLVATGLRSEREDDTLTKHYDILKRRLERGQYFRRPCFGCSEFPVKKIALVQDFDLADISPEILSMGDVDLGFMCYRLKFEDHGKPLNGDWDNPVFSDCATALYYRPHMIHGVINVHKYAMEGMKC